MTIIRTRIGPYRVFQWINSSNRSLFSKEQASKPTQHESRTIEQRKRDFTNLKSQLSFSSLFSPFWNWQQRWFFTAPILLIDQFPVRNERPAPQDTNPWRFGKQIVSITNLLSKKYKSNHAPKPKSKLASWSTSLRSSKLLRGGGVRNVVFFFNIDHRIWYSIATHFIHKSWFSGSIEKNDSWVYW